MLLVPLISVMLEITLKRLLYQDQGRFMSDSRQRLKGKVLRFELIEWNIPIILVFSECQVDVFNAWGKPADCIVCTRLAMLPALVECQRLAQMINQGDIDIEGDLHLVQQFSALLDMAKFDAAELLAPWIGDIAAEGITHSLRRLLSDTLQFLRTGQVWATQVITDEWRLTPSTLELAWFCSEVDDIIRVSKILADRLEKLEASNGIVR